MTGSASSSANSKSGATTAPGARTNSSPSTNTSPARGEPSSYGALSVGTVYTFGPNSPAREDTGSSRVYSPSQTANWLQCPILRQFKRGSTLHELGETDPHVWEPRGSGEWEPARLLGIAVQMGYNVHLKGDDGGVEEQVMASLGEGFQEQSKYTLLGLTKLALRGVEVLVDADLFNRHHVLEVDKPLTHSRPDVVSRHETEGLGVTDFKVAQRIDDRYRTKRMSEYETDDQFWHYAWEVGAHYGEPVKWLRAVQVILTPKALMLQERWEPTPTRLEFWLRGAQQHWRDMQAEDEGTREVAPRWANCRGGKYGVCVAYDYCHVFHGDNVKATTYYERVFKQYGGPQG